jgi:hypothetical protein
MGGSQLVASERPVNALATGACADATGRRSGFLAFSIEDGHASFLSSKFGEQSFFRMPIHAMSLR